MSQIVIPFFDCYLTVGGVIAKNVSVYGNSLFDRHLTEWLGRGNETGNEIGNDPEVIQIVIQMIQR